MKLTTSLALLLVINPTLAFAPKSAFVSPCPSVVLSNFNRAPASSFILRSSIDAPSDVESEAAEAPSKQQISLNPTNLRNELLYTAKSLTEDSPTGIFLTTPAAMDKFTTAVSRLEAITPSMTDRDKELLIGDWELVATSRGFKSTAVKVPEEMKKLPFNLKTPKLNESIRNSITVLQRIRSESTDSNDIDRIDHVIQYTPLKLTDLIPEKSPLSALRNWNVNPLEVSQSKITLVHHAKVESLEPTLRTKLGLKSVIVNVAGQSQYLDPKGADVLGLNIPSLGDFANGGSFDSTYVDENVRISRGTIGFLDEIRVFVRKGFDLEDIMENGYEAMMSTMEEEEMTEIEARLEKISGAVANVVGAVESLDKDVREVVEKDMETVGKAVDDVRGSIAEGVKDVQTVVEDDLKKVGKAVDDVRAAVVGENVKEAGEEEGEEETVVDVEATTAEESSEEEKEE